MQSVWWTGPNWLEFDRFDVFAKVPNNTPPETLKLMLQALLADRFKLVVHNDTRPLSGFVLTIGKSKPKLKEADASGKTGCQTQSLTAVPNPGGPISIPMTSISCHSTTMASFASTLNGLSGGYLTNTVEDSTGLKGSWDFELKWTPKPLTPLAGPDAVTIFDAIDKQLGLKL